MGKTLVLELQELYRIIPEAEILEGKNFKNINDLLKNLIERIEKSGQWQFVQYVNNNPSLFIIRENENSVINFEKSKRELNELINKGYDILKKKMDIETDYPEKIDNIPGSPTISETKLLSERINEPKLPWE